MKKSFYQKTAKSESIRKYSSRKEVHPLNCTDARINGLPLLNHQSCKNQTTANQPAVIPLETEMKVGFSGSASTGQSVFSFGSFLFRRNIEREKNSSEFQARSGSLKRAIRCGNKIQKIRLVIEF